MSASPERKAPRVPSERSSRLGWLMVIALLVVVAALYRSHFRRPEEPPVDHEVDDLYDLTGSGYQPPLPPVLFLPGRADLSPAAREALDARASAMAQDPSLLTVEIQSHADNGLTPAAAMALTRRRGDVVRDYLIAHHIDASRLEVCPYGQSRPRVINNTAEHRAANNRVLFLTRSTLPPARSPVAPTPSDPSWPPPCPPITLSGAAILFGVPDSDGDGVPAAEDHCPLESRAFLTFPRRTRCRGCTDEDRDHDGVNDDEDRCPTVRVGAHADRGRPGCPDGDVDADGVFDSVDPCPAPEGPRPDPARPGCPADDRDHDSVADALDRCADLPRGPQPDPARPGCPAPDRDHDTVADASDACPYEPGAPSSTASRSGCPGLVEVQPDRLLWIGPLSFARGAVRWSAASDATLVAAADALRASPWFYRVAVIARPGAGIDAALALRRAEAVADSIASRGVSACALESLVEPAEGDAPAIELRFLEQTHALDENAEVRPGMRAWQRDELIAP